MRSFKRYTVKTATGYVYWECIDNLMVGTTNDQTEAMKFNSEDAAEDFCMKNKIDDYQVV